jgi:hypothetical protein
MSNQKRSKSDDALKLARLRAEIEIGIKELDAGLGKPLDIEALIRKLRAKSGG